jgi:hypothetical protein
MGLRGGRRSQMISPLYLPRVDTNNTQEEREKRRDKRGGNEKK